MYFAIIDALSDFSRLTTVAHGDSISDIVMWFAAECHDNFEMYADEENASETKKALSECKKLCSMAKSDAFDLSEIQGLVMGAGDITIELVCAFDNFEDFKKGFEEFVSDKPKYKKIIPDENAPDLEKECDRINSLLVRESL